MEGRDYIKLIGHWAAARSCTFHFPSGRKGLVMKETGETFSLESFGLVVPTPLCRLLCPPGTASQSPPTLCCPYCLPHSACLSLCLSVCLCVIFSHCMLILQSPGVLSSCVPTHSLALFAFPLMDTWWHYYLRCEPYMIWASY